VKKCVLVFVLLVTLLRGGVRSVLFRGMLWVPRRLGCSSAPECVCFLVAISRKSASAAWCGYRAVGRKRRLCLGVDLVVVHVVVFAKQPQRVGWC